MNEHELTIDSMENVEDIEDVVKKQIDGTMPPLNRKQRRALRRKMNKKALDAAQDEIAEAAKTINYIDLIQKLRKLNEKKENENYEVSNEDN